MTKITKGISIPKWAESLNIHIHAVIGACSVPLDYITRVNKTQASDAPRLKDKQPHSSEHVLVEG